MTRWRRGDEVYVATERRVLRAGRVLRRARGGWLVRLPSYELVVPGDQLERRVRCEECSAAER